MATRARIGIQNDDGTIRSVYHHWDGYPEWLGKTLRQHFDTVDKVNTLIDGGDMSSCRTNVGFNNETRETTGPLYYSERGETTPAKVNSSFELYMGNNNALEEFYYLFLNNEWKCYFLRGEMTGEPLYIEQVIPEGDL
tara:strand:- start:632 stop:1045 length:414 start_codon:yes stop_codon:yes gene_type:complete